MTEIEKSLIELVKYIEGSGSFVMSDNKKLIPPGLVIAGLGEVGLPIVPMQAKALIDIAHKAPFGKGTETVMDTTVRSAWEIDADQLSFENEAWEGFLEKIVKKVKKELGLNQKIAANLYKLLIYEKGDFFLPHKDSEKEKGMFGTLIVGLPSKHTGGKLLVRFDGREEKVDFAKAASSYKIPYTAFFADCEHEIKPITSGYRVCLVYNLVQDSRFSKIESTLLSNHADEITELLKDWEPDFTNKPKAILLGHQYTPTNFSLDNLKHHDQPRAIALLEAAQKAGYFAKLGLVTSYLAGDCYDDDSYHNYRRRRYWDDDDDEESSSEKTMGDIHESYTQIKHWATDSDATLGELFIDEDDVLSEFTLGEGTPTKQEYEGYTGNAGMTLEYWYHYGAVILWPRNIHADFIKGNTAEVRLQWLGYYLKHWNNKTLQSQHYAKQITTGFTTDDLSKIKNNGCDYSPVATALSKFKDGQFAQKNCAALLVVAFDRISVKDWKNLRKAYPPKTFLAIFETAATSGKVFVVHHLLKILIASIPKNDAPDDFVSHFIKEIPVSIKKTKLHLIEKYNYERFERGLNRKQAIQAIIEQVLLLSKHQESNKKWMDDTLQSMTKSLPRPFVNDWLGTILLQKKYKGNALAKAVYQVCQQDLLKRTKKKPTPPKTWKRAVPKHRDYNKKIWEILTPFLQSPTQQVFDYVKNESARSNMTSAISNVTVDLKTQTIKSGRPYTLRITKTQDAYEKKLKMWEEDLALLKKLEQIWD